MLRETRTGHLALPTELRKTVVARALRSNNWLVRQEAARLGADEGTASPENPRLSGERFRRARDHRTVQIGLDMRDIDDAIAVARAADASKRCRSAVLPVSTKMNGSFSMYSEKVSRGHLRLLTSEP
ncbi:hypothetical protein [Amycolatopsis viridis]|uniref:Uncharacterized protein n=1 Tax=Amycolatopsis viridis TaxID=185678 RepID=A0ABX0SUP3_9PSEU|nr:hypothetical protein [Amycolatopsis viridis]NIH80689.1 hypothetical protein [Amycolatopsis viridis]